MSEGEAVELVQAEDYSLPFNDTFYAFRYAVVSPVFLVKQLPIF